MCAHPYDYCGPTFTGACDEPCCPNVRAGSILSGVAPVSEAAVEGIEEIEPGQIISVTDRAADEAPQRTVDTRSSPASR